ncbi:tRNA uridine-5-carboxymethylaminomethyl(34) synthesis enzyme MnmG, partial [bacterium]|nr:tRNA uridine-5-carboxymethylaminomethyl(34) synthesis enzyme MnmG [bacterium]
AKYNEHIDRGTRASELLKRPNINYNVLKEIDNSFADIPFDVSEQVEILTKYDGYLKRQEIQIEQASKLDKFKIPDDIDYSQITSISSETKDKLNKIRPKTLAQASRIGGVKPVDISVLMVLLERHQVARISN